MYCKVTTKTHLSGKNLTPQLGYSTTLSNESTALFINFCTPNIAVLPTAFSNWSPNSKTSILLQLLDLADLLQPANSQRSIAIGCCQQSIRTSPNDKQTFSPWGLKSSSCCGLRCKRSYSPPRHSLSSQFSLKRKEGPLSTT